MTAFGEFERSWAGISLGPGGDIAVIKLDQPGIIVAVAALIHLEDLGTKVDWQFSSGPAGLAAYYLLESRHVGGRGAPGLSMGVFGRAGAWNGGAMIDHDGWGYL